MGWELADLVPETKGCYFYEFLWINKEQEENNMINEEQKQIWLFMSFDNEWKKLELYDER